MSTHMVESKSNRGADREALQAKIDRLNAEAAANWDNPTWRREMAQQVTETILEGFQHENLLSLMSTVENVPFDGRVFVKETRGLRAFWTARGGYIEASTIRSESMEIPRDMIGFHVYENEDKLRTGFAETQSTLIDLGTQRLDAEVNLRALRLFQAAIQPSSPYYVQGAGLSLPALNTAIREVADATLNGGQVVIVGRRTMTDQIADELISGNYAGFLPETNEALVQRGVLGTYRGARIVALRNFKDDEDLPFFPANEMFVMAQDASKFGFWGGLLAKDYVEDDNWYWHYIARRDFGGVVHRPDRVRRIVDTSIPA
jgi:hypothetical protein